MYHERQHLQHCLKHTINNLLQQEAFTTAALNQLCDSIQATRTRLLGNHDANVLTVALQQHGLEVKWHDPRDTELTSLTVQLPALMLHSEVDQPLQCLQGQQQSNFMPVQQQQQLQECVIQQQYAAEQQQVHQQTISEPLQSEQQLFAESSGAAGCWGNGSSTSCLFGVVLNVKGRGPWAWLTGGRHWLAIKCMSGQWWNLDSRFFTPQSFVTSQDDQADGGTGRLREFLKQQLADGAHILLVHKQQQAAEAS